MYNESDRIIDGIIRRIQLCEARKLDMFDLEEMEAELKEVIAQTDDEMDRRVLSNILAIVQEHLAIADSHAPIFNGSLYTEAVDGDMIEIADNPFCDLDMFDLEELEAEIKNTIANGSPNTDILNRWLDLVQDQLAICDSQAPIYNQTVVGEGFDEFGNEVNDYEVHSMDAATMNNRASTTLADKIERIFNLEFERRAGSIDRILNRNRCSTTNIPFIAKGRFNDVKNIFETAIIDVMKSIRRRLDTAAASIDPMDETSYRHEQSQAIRRTLITTVLSVIINRNVLRIDSSAVDGTRKIIEPVVQDMVNELANNYIDGRSYEEQDKRAIKKMMRGAGRTARKDADRGIYSHARTVMRG